MGGDPVEFTATEYALLRLLSVNAGRVVHHDTILRQVWDGRDGADANLVGIFVRTLRAKLGDSAEAPAADGGATSYAYPDHDWKLGVVAMGPQGPDPIRRVLTFVTEPMAADLEVTGPAILELYAASTATDTDFVIRIAESKEFM